MKADREKKRHQKSSCCCHHTSQSTSAGTHSYFTTLPIFTLGQTLFTVPAYVDLNRIIPVYVPLIKSWGVKSSPGRNECYRNIGEVHSGKQVGAKMKFFFDNEHQKYEGFFFILPHWVACWWHGFDPRLPPTVQRQEFSPSDRKWPCECGRKWMNRQLWYWLNPNTSDWQRLWSFTVNHKHRKAGWCCHLSGCDSRTRHRPRLVCSVSIVHNCHLASGCSWDKCFFQKVYTINVLNN